MGQAYQNITGNEVVREAELIAKPAMERAGKAVKHLHDAGYHDYSRAMSNFLVRIESALGKLDDEIGAM